MYSSKFNGNTATNTSNDVSGQTIPINHQTGNHLKSVITLAPESQFALPVAHPDLPIAKIPSTFLLSIPQNIDLCDFDLCVTAALHLNVDQYC